MLHLVAQIFTLSTTCAEYGCVGYSPSNTCQCNPSCDKYDSCCADFAATCVAPPPPPAPPFLPGQCTTHDWPDVEVVCPFATTDHPAGECKALVDKILSVYKNCDGYCAVVGRVCVNAFEEKSDSCTVKTDDVQDINGNNVTMDCTTMVDSTDTICECGALTSATSTDKKLKKLTAAIKTLQAN